MWNLFFRLLNLRIGEVDLPKISSRIEDIGVRAVMDGFAELVSIIGNALADEAAELAVKLIRPPQDAIKEADRIEAMAFNVCVRLGMVQARIWEVLGNAPIHEGTRRIPQWKLMRRSRH